MRDFDSSFERTIPIFVYSILFLFILKTRFTFLSSLTRVDVSMIRNTMGKFFNSVRFVRKRKLLHPFKENSESLRKKKVKYANI